MATKYTYMDKNGSTITADMWMKLQSDPMYAVVNVQNADSNIIITEWVGMDIHTPKHYFRTFFYIKEKKGQNSVGIIWTRTLQEAKVAHDKIVKEIKVTIEKENPVCPLCQEPMVLKNGKFGYFWGCTSWTKTGCTGKRKVKTGKPTNNIQEQVKKKLENIKNNNILASRAGSIDMD